MNQPGNLPSQSFQPNTRRGLPARGLRPWLLLLGLAALPATLHSLDWGRYQPTRHNRYYSGAGRAFLADPMDLSGIGRVNGVVQWATLLTPRHFLSAAHWHPEVGDTLRFYGTNRRGLPAADREVVAGAAIPDSDLWVGTLDEPLPATYRTYPVVAPEHLPDLSGQTAFPVGFAAADAYALGLGLVVLALDELEPAPFVRYAESGDTVHGEDSAHTIVGDSGGPLFLVYQGQPALLGIHSEVDADVPVPLFLEELSALCSGETLRVARLSDLPAPVAALALADGAWTLTAPHSTGRVLLAERWDGALGGWQPLAEPLRPWAPLRQWPIRAEEVGNTLLLRLRVPEIP